MLPISSRISPLPPEPWAPGSTPACRIPSGVPDFDFITGGFPAGSVVLLWGDAGAGHTEFAVTSAVHLMLRFDDPERHRLFLGDAGGPFTYPQGVVYVSVSRSHRQVFAEIESAFEGGYARTLANHTRFEDLSPEYFQDTAVPGAWASLDRPLLSASPASRSGARGPLRRLVEILDEAGPMNLVLVDSLTDLLVRPGIESLELLTFLKGLRRRAKEWGGVVYLLLSRGVAPAPTEQAVVDSVDGVLSFRWSVSPTLAQRQRVLLIEKFLPVLARIPEERQGRFVIRLESGTGLVTTQHERI
jgi:KaiC/GvpD/RAD55 family RecA-like ATPase